MKRPKMYAWDGCPVPTQHMPDGSGETIAWWKHGVEHQAPGRWKAGEWVWAKPWQIRTINALLRVLGRI